MKTKNVFASVSAAFLVVSASSLWAEAMKLAVDENPPVREGSHAGYASIVEKVMPSVVSITSKKNVVMPKALNRQYLDPFSGRLFQRREMVPGETVPQPQGSGSGVIISTDGYIVTNNHVIAEADEVQVAVGEDEKLYNAEIVGTDEATDLAILKIKGEGFPAVKIGASHAMKSGDFVLAMGSPFNLPNTVTQGIISAMGRTDLQITGRAGYEDFIQTDASINPGNSGGALVDNQGRMIGINTAIFSRSGGNMGIGFAIPSDLVVNVAEQLIEFGEVQRGFLGVNLGDVTDELAMALGVEGDGAIVHEVVEGAPAEAAGIQGGDVITHLNGKPVEDAARLRLLVGSIRPDTKVTFKILRDGEEKTIECTIGSREKRTKLSSRSGLKWGGAGANELIEGLRISDLDRALRARLGIPSDISGVFIEEVKPGSVADQAGLRAGEIISQINRQSVKNADEALELKSKVMKSSGKKVLLLRVLSERGSRYIAVSIA